MTVISEIFNWLCLLFTLRWSFFSPHCADKWKEAVSNASLRPLLDRDAPV